MNRRALFALIFAMTALLPLSWSIASAAEPRTVTLDVPGMTCRFCPITIRKALEKLPGVLEAKADYASKTATVTYDPEQVTPEDLTRTTANAGYESTVRSGPKP